MRNLGGFFMEGDDGILTLMSEIFLTGFGDFQSIKQTLSGLFTLK